MHGRKVRSTEPKHAPDQIRNAVMLGYNILINTQKYAADYVGNDLNCHNCHFEGGITKGGKNGGISGNPHLTKEQALDVAAYLTNQPMAKFTKDSEAW